MPKQSKSESRHLQTYTLLYLTRDAVFRCVDRVVAKFRLTAEQYSVLSAIRELEDPVRPTDIGRLVDHKVNTVSMIIDRMVRAGLIDRVRDVPDRREVRLVITSKGEKAFKPAAAEASKLIQEIMSPLSDKEVDALEGLLKRVREKAHKFYKQSS
jgi:MarR family transcriptional regulator, organic hydroperoxide resistance regulator